MKWRHVGSLFLTSLFLTTTARAQLDTPSEAVVPTTHSESSALWVRAGLHRTMALSLDHVTLRTALDTIAALGHVRLLYAREVVPLDNIISITASSITVANALRMVLATTGVGVTIAPSGQLVLRALALGQPVLSAPTPVWDHQQGTATLTGSVTDSGTGVAIPQVTVHIDGTSLSVKSSADGLYKIPNIAAGEYRVTARRVGYLAKTRMITLSDGDKKRLDFGLNPPATQLNEVVTTALGEQRRYEVGNVISTINVDSVAPNAPVTSVTDLLAARVPGLEVVQSSGLAGAGPDIRIRGQSSLILQSDPIIIVDGIRVDNTPGGNNQMLPGAPAPARINDLDFNEIESISVLKGPTATTEYGTDAANGVIVITTKRGHAGVPTWTASATESAVIMPVTYANNYWDWGHLANGTATPTWSDANPYGAPCNFAVAFSGQPNLSGGNCVVDSITAFNPLDHGATSEYGTGPSNNYDLSVGGGSEQVRYYLAGNMQNMEGLIHVPDVFRSQALGLGYPNSALNPNSQNQGRLSANGVIQMSPKVQITVSGAYANTYMEAPAVGGFSTTYLYSAPTLDDSAFLFGYGSTALCGDYCDPIASLGSMTSQETEGWRGAATIDWHPTQWLATHVTTGIDHEAQTDQLTALPAANIVQSNYADTTGGSINVDQIRNDIYTIDLAASATAVVTRYLRLITTLGAQYAQATADGVQAYGYNLPASAFTLTEATGEGGNTYANQSASSAATEGVYVEEQLNLGDRCFMPLALRLDAGSAFGSAVGSQNYPKWGLSCLVLTGATTVRLRGAYGAAGVQPPEGSATSEYGATYVFGANGSSTTGYDFQAPGNPNVRPEDDREWEGGAEVNAWGSRLSVSVTTYNKYVHNDLYTTQLGYFLPWSITENIGDVRNMGWELETTIVPVETQSLTAVLTLSGSVNHNKLLRLAPNILSDNVGLNEFFVPGYPLYAYFGDTVRYTDLNHDGIIEPNEVYTEQYDGVGTSQYMGSSLPVTQMTAQPSLAFFRHQLLQMNAVFQYQGGYKVWDQDEQNEIDQSANTLGAPLWLQAYNIGLTNNELLANSFLDGSFLSWNELSIAVAAPTSWLRLARLRNVHVVLGVENLALWTVYPFGDPRVSVGSAAEGGAVSSSNQATNQSTVNNDVRAAGATAVPLTRQWMIRLNLGF